VYNVVAADFAASAGHPLLKSKFNVYDPAGITFEQLDQSLAKLGALNVDTYRMELAWGRARQGFGTKRSGTSRTERTLSFRGRRRSIRNSIGPLWRRSAPWIRMRSWRDQWRTIDKVNRSLTESRIIQ
jgi:hypothetical protein